MPGITQYVLQGGPCDGNTGTLTPEAADSRQMVCKGGIYKVQSPARVISGREVFKYAGKAPTPGTTVKAAAVHTGWGDVRKSVNQHLPAALRASHRNTGAALRTLSRARRVRI